MSILGIKVEHILEPVASKLAHMSDADQAAFFSVFIDELTKACGTNFLTMQQLGCVSAKLTSEQRETLKVLSGR